MKNIFTIILLLIFYSTTINLGNEYFSTFGRWIYLSGILSAIMIIFYLLMNKKTQINYNKWNLILMTLFFISNVITAIKSVEINLLLFSIMFYILFVTLQNFIPSLFKNRTYNMTIILFLVIHIPIILLPLLIEKRINIPYHGGFQNENSMGLTATIVLVIVYSLVLKNLEEYFIDDKFRMISTLIWSTFIILLLVLIASTGSRTSFVTSLIILMVGIALFLFNLLSKAKIHLNKLIKILFRASLGIPLIGGALFIVNKYLPVSYYIQESIIDKFNRQVDKGRLLSGRDYVWRKTIEESTLFGNGTEFFNDSIGTSAHNTFIHILGVYGWSSTILFVIIVITFGIQTVKHFRVKINPNRYLPVMVFLAFLGLSMAENLMYNISLFLLFLLLGLTQYKNKLIITN